MRNADFEGGYSHKNFTGIEYAEIVSPDYWLFWWSEEDGYRRPETKIFPKAADPLRVRSGNNAFQAFTYFGKQHCGLWKVVTGLQPGAVLRFTGYAHAWSGHHEDLDPGGPHCSTGVGCGPVYILSENVPPLSGAEHPTHEQKLNDAIGNFTFQVGVGSGEADPFDPEISWGKGASIYNGYSEPMRPIEFTVPANGAVVLYVRSISLWKYRNSDAYFDDFSLEIVSEPGFCRGAPRIQYLKTGVLFPHDVTRAEAHHLLDQYFDDKRSLFFSADDVAVGDLDSRTVIAHRPSSWPGDLKAFYEEHYPGITYVPIVERNYVAQCDLPWKDYHYGMGTQTTVCAAGCWICDVVNALKYFDIDPEATPITVDQAVGAAGYTSSGRMKWSALPQLGIEVVKSTTSVQEAQAWLDQGRICFAEVAPLTLEHFVMITEHRDGKYWMIDPLSGRETWLDELYWGVDSWRLIRQVQVEPPPPPPVTIHSTTSFQQQRAAEYRDEFISRVQPPMWMLIGGFEEAAHLKSLAPDMEIVIRHVEDDWNSYLFASDLDAAAERWVRHYGETLFNQAEHIDYILDLNEYIATNDYPALQATAPWLDALVRRMEAVGWPARIIGLNTAVGNPQTNSICDAQGIPRQIPLLTPAVSILEDNDCLVGYHSYWGVRKEGPNQYHCSLDSDEGRFFEMRALYEWDPVFRAAGVYPHYAFTEGGAIYLDPHYGTPSAAAGWKWHLTYDGDVTAYINSILQFDDTVGEWNKQFGNRAPYTTLFLHGNYGWELFEMAGDPSKLLADALIARR